MENVLLYTFPQQQLSGNFFLVFLRKTTHLHFTFSPPHPHHHHLRFSFTTTTPWSSRKWDSNAETVRAQKVNFTFNFDKNDDEEEEEEESLSENERKKKSRWWSKTPRTAKKKPVNVFDEAIESIWIFKVFKSFGWFSPAILISFLLANGPKAFLMALALPLVLSVLYLAFEKLRGKTQKRTKRAARIRRKTSSRSVSGTETNEKRQEGQETRKVMSENQARVKGSKDTTRPSFGGWEYLEEGPMRGTSEVVSESQRTDKGTLSGSGRRSDAPLLLRLLIAVFPFIGFCAKMFW